MKIVTVINHLVIILVLEKKIYKQPKSCNLLTSMTPEINFVL